jgi:hypothetical protein
VNPKCRIDPQKMEQEYFLGREFARFIPHKGNQDAGSIRYCPSHDIPLTPALKDW